MATPILTPCIGLCSLDAAGYCEGCFRTGDEIARWSLMNDVERQRLMDDELLPAGEPLRPAAVLVGLREHGHGTTVLLTRRQDALRHHAGQISFPGGRVDLADAGPLAAALRETEEEVGLPASSISPMGWLDPYATITGFHVYPLVARIDHERPLRPSADEVAEAFEVPLDFLLDPASARDVAMEWRGRTRLLVEFHWQDYRIWGATAAMLVNLRDRLQAAAAG